MKRRVSAHSVGTTRVDHEPNLRLLIPGEWESAAVSDLELVLSTRNCNHHAASINHKNCHPSEFPNADHLGPDNLAHPGGNFVGSVLSADSAPLRDMLGVPCRVESLRLATRNLDMLVDALALTTTSKYRVFSLKGTYSTRSK